ncbi:hypothetical protein RCL1_001620 [Eukaryota sp. TZLM3-RCL]
MACSLSAQLFETPQLVEFKGTVVHGIECRSTMELIAQEFEVKIRELLNLIGDISRINGPLYSIYTKAEMDPSKESEFFIGFESDIENSKTLDVPAAKCLVMSHIGDYSALMNTYNVMMAHMAKENLQIAGNCFEVYVNSPDYVPTEELRTDIYFPVF